MGGKKGGVSTTKRMERWDKEPKGGKKTRCP